MKKITFDCSFWFNGKWKNIVSLTKELGYNFTPELYKDINGNYVIVINKEYFVVKKDESWIDDYKVFLKKLNNKLKLYMGEK